MKLRGGEFSTGTTGIFQPELTQCKAFPHSALVPPNSCPFYLLNQK